ncbi:amidase [Oceanobacter kriegii]|uniref:amidase n=1 Tax=Oceanobacter kriegii TaxID=64972 RepID=UPI000419E836|nr:amidase [Oceanobacter kriegii]
MQAPENLAHYSLMQMLEGIESGAFCTEDVIHACFDQIEQREPEVQAWQYRLQREEYLAQYRSRQAFYDQSLLKGLPLGVKDIIDTADMPTELGSPIHKGRQPVDDATCVVLLKQAGAIVLGKTVTTEFAYFKPGATRNPADISRTPGGSSSGSAAAVADFMVPMALGSQTAASVIRPAAYCGAVGYVGSRGEYSLRGGQPLAQSLDSLGVFARQADDIALLRAVLLRTGSEHQTAAVEAPRKPAKILMCPGSWLGPVSVEMATALEEATEQLLKAGVTIAMLDQDVAGDQGLGGLVEHHATIMAWEVCRNLAAEAAQPELLSPQMQDLINKGLAMSREDYLAALAAVDQARLQLHKHYPDVDAIITPAAPDIAPLAEEGTGSPHMSRAWQALGLPTVTLTGVKNRQGIPLGLQLVGRSRGDDALLATAAWVNRVVEVSV